MSECSWSNCWEVVLFEHRDLDVYASPSLSEFVGKMRNNALQHSVRFNSGKYDQIFPVVSE